MTNKELRKLNRAQILELFLEQCKRNEALEKELAEVKAELESKKIRIEESGSIAEASLKLTNIFEEAQKAVDLFMANMKGEADQEALNDSAEENKAEEVEKDLEESTEGQGTEAEEAEKEA